MQFRLCFINDRYLYKGNVITNSNHFTRRSLLSLLRMHWVLSQINWLEHTRSKLWFRVKGLDFPTEATVTPLVSGISVQVEVHTGPCGAFSIYLNPVIWKSWQS